MIRQLLFIFGLWVLACSQVSGQGTDPLLTTVGTTVEADGRTYTYILWQPGEAGTTFGKRYAVYSKEGDLAANSDFQRLGIQRVQTNPTTIRALLEVGAKIDADAEDAPTRIDGIYRDITLNSNAAASVVNDVTLDAAGKLAYLIESAVIDPELLDRMFFLGRAHPGVMMALGHAFAIQVEGAGLRTYEIREIDDSNVDVQVVGRVELDLTNPFSAPAPGAPVAIAHQVDPDAQFPISPKDHLNVRLRWGVPSKLRAALPFTFGYDLYRVKAKVAEGLGWDNEPPSPSQMVSAIRTENESDSDPDFSRVNALPILLGDRLLTLAEAADTSSDPERFDLADDGIYYYDEGGDLTRREFLDGEQFYYYVAARGITGYPGELSSGTLVTMCDRLPPSPPRIFSVLGDFVKPTNAVDWAAQAGEAIMEVKFEQVPQALGRDAAERYYIYRWNKAGEHLEQPGNTTRGRIGMMTHQAGQEYAVFRDTTPGAPTVATASDQTVWYTIRAVGQSACAGETLGGHSPPAGGVLRDFSAPDAADGTLLVCRTKVAVEKLSRQTSPPDNFDLADFVGISVNVARQSSAVVAAKIKVSSGDQTTQTTLYDRQHYFQSGNELLINLPFREPVGGSQRLSISVQAITSTGRVSNVATATSPTLEFPVDYAIYRFIASGSKVCDPIETITENPVVHESRDDEGKVNPVEGTVTVPANQGVGEWRVYRRVGSDGPLTLIFKREEEGSAEVQGGGWSDPTPPHANGARVCYYSQTIDKNGNPSELKRLGCMQMANPDLPTPMLSPVTVQNGSSGAEVRLEWFCDPVGVDRFEILVAQDGGGIPNLGGISDVLGQAAIAGVSSDRPELAFYPFQSPRITSAYGPGPSFAQSIGIPTDKRLYFAVRAVGPGAFPRTSGSASNVAEARWQTPLPPNQPVIPWPARPLPSTFEMRRPIDAYLAGEGPLWSIRLPNDFGIPVGILVGLVPESPQSNSSSGMPIDVDIAAPEDLLFDLRNPGGGGSRDELMPFLVYRYQIPSAAFPNARPNLSQCTPLIDRLSYKKLKVGNSYQLNDPFFIGLPLDSSIELPIDGAWGPGVPPILGDPSTIPAPAPYLENGKLGLYLKDQLPVIRGAQYRHVMVMMTDDGEIRQVVALNPVQF